MPILDLENLPEEIQLLNITSIMIYPSVEEATQRNSWRLKELLKIAGRESSSTPEDVSEELKMKTEFEIGQWLSKELFQLGGWAALRNATVGPGQKMSPAQEIKNRWPQGLVVGNVLGIALENQVGFEEAAIRYVKEEKQMSKRVDAIQASVKTINDNWKKKFKESLHLWWALTLCDNNDNTRSTAEYIPINQWFTGGISQFVEISNDILNLGSKSFPRRGSKQPILSKTASWKIKI